MDKILEVDSYGEVNRTTNNTAWSDFVQSMDRNNTFCPGISRIIFNLKLTDTRPVVGPDGEPVRDEKGRVKRETVNVAPELATIVYFKDGTKTAVVNSDSDVVKTEEIPVTYTDVEPDGKEVTVKTKKMVTVATEAAKEAGIVYAIVKRMFGVRKVDKKTGKLTDEIIGDGFGRKLRDITQRAFDCQYQDAWNDVYKDLCRAEHAKREAEAKERRANRTPTVEENIATLVKQNAELLAQLAAKA